MKTLNFDDLNKHLNNRERCSKFPNKNILFLGPPGSGKGTQARLLSDYLCYCHLSSGDLIRDAIKKGHPAGQKAKELMEKGELVSDEISIEVITPVVKSPECAKGIIFDGFPRELSHVPYLNKMLEPLGRKIDLVLEFKILEEDLISRIEGRRIHLASGRTYHTRFNPPKVEDLDDITNEPLFQRKDDNSTTLRKRLEVYNLKTKPLVNYYRQKGILRDVDSSKFIEELYEEIKKKLL